MGTKTKAKPMAPKAKKRQTKIDGYNFDKSRRTWQPDWEALEKQLERSNKYLRRKNGRPPINA
jgi:hypothetical protein